MSTEITWLGHNAWSIRAGEHRLLLDPFLNDNPLSPKKADEVEADFILVSSTGTAIIWAIRSLSPRGLGPRLLASSRSASGCRRGQRAFHESGRRP